MHIQHFIDGKFVDSLSGKTFETINPATGEVLGTVAEGGVEDAALAVAAAHKAFEEGPWPRMRPAERAAILRRTRYRCSRLPLLLRTTLPLRISR